MTDAEIGLMNQLKSALKNTGLFVVDRSTPEKKILILYRKGTLKNTELTRSASVKNFIIRTRKIAGITKEVFDAQPAVPLVGVSVTRASGNVVKRSGKLRPPPEPGTYWWNKDD